MAPKLKNTCLCAIVRDEKVNPAGGILDYVQSVVPHVDAAIIVDTGSTDGTREILEECAGKYKNLKIYDRKFTGFADARNYSLKKGRTVGTGYCLVLDADERLTKKDFKHVNGVVKDRDGFDHVYKFGFKHMLVGGQLTDVPDWQERLFGFETEPSFENALWETLSFGKGSYSGQYTGVPIKHFLPPHEGRVAKRDWYDQIESSADPHQIRENPMAPSQHEDFSLWKEVNPHRDRFR